VLQKNWGFNEELSNKRIFPFAIVLIQIFDVNILYICVHKLY
jgi:hypothetical protein